ncbi:cytochrome P450 [Cercophora scortea]|uniref:Cytochrome P450 n=1 Tax=Cercophora scortea TaxID=314031 RepID=A0AAE0M4Q5_9PEZI|nr:cytochrome P450 [Cercophora scortea]
MMLLNLFLSAMQVTLLAVAVVLAYYIFCYLISPLKDIPGPVLAKFTNLWRVHDCYKCTTSETQMKLHAKHGVAVRLGPNMVALNDPSLIPVIYNARGTFLKSSFYSASDSLIHGKKTEHIFSTRSNKFHLEQLTPVQKFYSIQGVLAYEDSIDRALLLLCEQLETRFVNGANAGKTCDIADWISYFAWDLMAEITWSSEMGFMRTGSDVDNMIAINTLSMKYLGLIGQVPWFAKLLSMNAYRPQWVDAFDHALYFSLAQLAERQRASQSASSPETLIADPEKGSIAGDKKDYIASFLEAKKLYPDGITDENIVMYILTNLSAGADSIATVQRAIIYHLIRNPTAHDKLRAELDAANLPFPASYDETHNSSKLPYLEAVIKEGLRIHPPVGLCLERVVPSPGLELPDGRFIPAGTTVGVNPSVVTRDRQAYGPDADEFRPDRWLRRDGEDAEGFVARLRRMDELNTFVWGGGNRTCLGRFLATTILYKATAALVGRYDFVLEDPAKEWTVRRHWLVENEDIKVRIAQRAVRAVSTAC